MCEKLCKFKEKVFTFHDEKLMFSDARIFCQNYFDGDLATLNSDDDTWNHIKNCCYTKTHIYAIGLNLCKAKNDVFGYRWLNSTKCSDVSPLISPVESTARKCNAVVVQLTNEKESKYPKSGLVDCNSKHSFICQYNSEHMDNQNVNRNFTRAKFKVTTNKLNTHTVYKTSNYFNTSTKEIDYYNKTFFINEKNLFKHHNKNKTLVEKKYDNLEWILASSFIIMFLLCLVFVLIYIFRHKITTRDSTQRKTTYKRFSSFAPSNSESKTLNRTIGSLVLTIYIKIILFRRLI